VTRTPPHVGSYVVVVADSSDWWAVGLTGRLLASNPGAQYPHLVELDDGPPYEPQTVRLNRRVTVWPEWHNETFAQWMEQVRPATPEEVAAHQLAQAGGL
jgi:hypothetical protein